MNHVVFDLAEAVLSPTAYKVQIPMNPKREKTLTIRPKRVFYFYLTKKNINFNTYSIMK